MPIPLKKQTFPVTGMSCAACASSVESILSQTPGVQAAAVNFASQSVLISYESQTPETNLQQALQAVGYDLIIDTENAQELQDNEKQRAYNDIKKRTLASAIAYPSHLYFGDVFHGLGARKMDFLCFKYSRSFLFWEVFLHRRLQTSQTRLCEYGYLGRLEYRCGLRF